MGSRRNIYNSIFLNFTLHYVLWALDLIYDYFFIFISTFTPDAMYNSILSNLLCTIFYGL